MQCLSPTDRTIVPGRFRAHAAARLAPTSPFASSSNNASSASSASNGRHPFSLRAASSSSSGGGGRSTALLTPTKRRRRLSTRRDLRSNKDQQQQQVNERTWLLRPSRDRVESWLDAWWKRWLVLVIVPSLIVSNVCANTSGACAHPNHVTLTMYALTYFLIFWDGAIGLVSLAITLKWR